MINTKQLGLKPLFNLILRYSDNLCLILTNDLVIKEISTTALKTLGWEKKEVLNQPIESVFKKYSIQPFIEINKPVKKAKTSTYVLNNSRELKINWNIIPLYDQDKKIDLVFVIGRLATELTDKQIEYLQLENVVKYAPGFFYWKNKNGVYQGCNDEFANLAGLDSRTQVIGKTDFELIWKERAQLYVDVDQEVMRTGKPKLNHEEKIIVSNNRTITAITNKVPLLDSHNKVVGILGITTDITQQKMTEEALSLAKIDAESANVLKTNFIQNMQHDIRTPASSVWAVLNDLVENEQIPDKELLTLLRNSSKQLLKICNDVIDFDKIEQGEIPILSKRFDMREIVSDVIELNQIAAFDRGLNLSFSIDKKIPRVLKGDEHRLSRILINLIGNAIKFTSQGYIKITADLIKESKKNYLVQFKLQDTGIGIPLEKQNTLYEKFNRLNPANRNSYKGSGLGLRIVKKYVSDLEGEINVKSELNKGTTFFIDIPFEKALVETVYDKSQSYSNLALKMEKRTTKVQIEIPQESTNQHTVFKVLLIEDTELALKAAQKILKSLNYAVNTTVDVKSSLELLNREKFDLVISDIGLPDGTGIDLIKMVKEDNDSLNQSTPFFALTANADTKTIEKSKHAGYLTVMEKPLHKETILSLINQFIEENLSIDSQALPLELIVPELKSQFFCEHMMQKNPVPTPTPEPSSEDRLGVDLPNTEAQLFELEQYPLFDEFQALETIAEEAILVEILHDLVKAIPQYKLEIFAAHKEGDWELVEKLAHKYKGSALYTGTSRMRYACQYLERYRKAGHSKSLEKLFQQLIKTLDETRQAITNWLNRG